jgi:hypothetical protein
MANEGLRRSRRARLKHGCYSAAEQAKVRQFNAEARVFCAANAVYREAVFAAAKAIIRDQVRENRNLRRRLSRKAARRPEVG